MRVRHSETRSMEGEPSVGFYRTIAFSFLALTVVLLGVVVFVTTKKAEITIMAKEDGKQVNIALSVKANGTQPLPDGFVNGSVSSTEMNFSEKYFPTGSKTVEGVATGEVTLYNKTAEPQVLVKTTRLLTPSGILFRLTDKVTVPANGNVVASVYADKAGADGSIGASSFTIPGLDTAKQKVVYAQSDKAMVNGERKIGILTQDDVDGAKKDFAEKVKQQVVLASTTEGYKQVVSILNVNPVVDKKVGDEVDGFTLTGTSTAIVVTYNNDDLNKAVEVALSTKIDTTVEKILKEDIEPKVSVVSYDGKTQAAQLSVDENLTVSLDVNAEKLSPQYFLSKKKDEIERYVFELAHVAGVDVKFSPFWTTAAPSVPDKIKISVQTVK